MTSLVNRVPQGAWLSSSHVSPSHGSGGTLTLPKDSVARRSVFRRFLTEGTNVLFDGAVATVLYERGVFINRSFDEVNLANPELVAEVHREYLAAGAHVLTANTWGANACKLKAYGLEGKVREINLAGARIATQAAGDDAWVAGSLGPLGVRIEPWGPTSFDDARDFFREQALALVEGGVDLFVLETFADLNEIHQAIRAVRELGDFPVVATMTTNDEGQVALRHRTRMVHPETLRMGGRRGWCKRGKWACTGARTPEAAQVGHRQAHHPAAKRGFATPRRWPTYLHGEPRVYG